ncbi:hypothetical protein DFJ73DRAFT_535874 [Zopfochytrium polystomum]|nr:hypothetical protein DFJ73DRAFT_535874 [Zopfochytrium polystomum]
MSTFRLAQKLRQLEEFADLGDQELLDIVSGPGQAAIRGRQRILATLLAKVGCGDAINRLIENRKAEKKAEVKHNFPETERQRRDQLFNDAFFHVALRDLAKLGVAMSDEAPKWTDPQWKRWFVAALTDITDRAVRSQQRSPASESEHGASRVAQGGLAAASKSSSSSSAMRPNSPSASRRAAPSKPPSTSVRPLKSSPSSAHTTPDPDLPRTVRKHRPERSATSVEAAAVPVRPASSGLNDPDGPLPVSSVTTSASILRQLEQSRERADRLESQLQCLQGELDAVKLERDEANRLVEIARGIQTPDARQIMILTAQLESMERNLEALKDADAERSLRLAAAQDRISRARENIMRAAEKPQTGPANKPPEELQRAIKLLQNLHL